MYSKIYLSWKESLKISLKRQILGQTKCWLWRHETRQQYQIPCRKNGLKLCFDNFLIFYLFITHTNNLNYSIYFFERQFLPIFSYRVWEENGESIWSSNVVYYLKHSIFLASRENRCFFISIIMQCFFLLKNIVLRMFKHKQNIFIFWKYHKKR